MLGRVLRWLGPDDGGDPVDATDGLDRAAPNVECGGDGPRRRYTCAECDAEIEGFGPDRQVTCPECETDYCNCSPVDRPPVSAIHRY
jgi:hypothetical protein